MVLEEIALSEGGNVNDETIPQVITANAATNPAGVKNLPLYILGSDQNRNNSWYSIMQ